MSFISMENNTYRYMFRNEWNTNGVKSRWRIVHRNERGRWYTKNENMRNIIHGRGDVRKGIERLCRMRGENIRRCQQTINTMNNIHAIWITH